jgi:hypothetical protein
VGGGFGNRASGSEATVAGGENNSASQQWAFVGGGFGNSAGGLEATVSGGLHNTASGTYSFVGGGYSNTAAASFATVAGGDNNTAAGAYSFAAGQQAQALHLGAFVWADSQNAPFASTANDQFLIRSQGGVGIGTVSPTALLTVSSPGGDSFPQAQIDQSNTSDYARLRFTANGAYSTRWDVAANTGAFVIYSGQIGAEMLHLDSSGLTVRGTLCCSSDRNAKEDFQPVTPAEILNEVDQLPISTWSFRSDPASRHLGPTAQDFHAAFGLNGGDETHIATVDEAGVALAAIQGLNQKLEARSQELEVRSKQLEAENKELKHENESLEKRLDALEKISRNQKQH